MMKWNSFTMAQNEEEMISDTLSCVRTQTIKPTRIHVLNDGSTDSTGTILDGMKDLILTHVSPHPPQLAEKQYHERRYRLMLEAAEDVDYVACIDADTEIPPNYMERITTQMKSDNVVVASGKEPTNPQILSIEPGMVINVKWLQRQDDMSSFPMYMLPEQSVVDGYPSIVYTNVPLHYKRKLGTNYDKTMPTHLGREVRMRGMRFPFLVYRSIRIHSFRFFWAYVTYKGKTMPKPFQDWFNDYLIALFKFKRGLKSGMFQKTDVGVFVLPKNYTRLQSVNEKFPSAAHVYQR